MTSGMNRYRGDVPLEIDGEVHTLRLTLGALAQIETALGTDDLAGLTARLANPSARDLLVILSALLGGGGHDLPVDTLKSKTFDLKAATATIARAFALALGAGEGADDGERPGKPQFQNTGAAGAGPGSA
ncbi:hypothetical protein GCM10011342_17470 [Aquisalinus flavus]|uniref:Uncharacterized protein n=2 Tax=Aquisalinus flavus TaxID=1526572 RepID=A0A8J2Y7X9_9PROT|nr:hypothetical protein GCM10011342_17470 [Aquisalinus flavus]